MSAEAAPPDGWWGHFQDGALHGFWQEASVPQQVDLSVGSLECARRKPQCPLSPILKSDNVTSVHSAQITESSPPHSRGGT